MNSGAFASLPASACTLGIRGSPDPDRITKNFYDGAGQLVQVRKAVGTSFIGLMPPILIRATASRNMSSTPKAQGAVVLRRV